MPKILDIAIKKIMSKGKTEQQARAIAIATLQKAGDLKKGTIEATKKGIKLGDMTAGQRLKARIEKYRNK